LTLNKHAARISWFKYATVCK